DGFQVVDFKITQPLAGSHISAAQSTSVTASATASSKSVIGYIDGELSASGDYCSGTSPIAANGTSSIAVTASIAIKPPPQPGTLCTVRASGGSEVTAGTGASMTFYVDP